MAKYHVHIDDDGVWVTQTVVASSPEDALDIVEAEIRAANARGDYGVGGQVLPAGTRLSLISCSDGMFPGLYRRVVFA